MQDDGGRPDGLNKRSSSALTREVTMKEKSGQGDVPMKNPTNNRRTRIGLRRRMYRNPAICQQPANKEAQLQPLGEEWFLGLRRLANVSAASRIFPKESP
jgi:hypothetical protein